MTRAHLDHTSSTRLIWLAVIAGVITLAMKMAAYLVTGSIGILSDAVESVVNIVTAILTLLTVHVARRPPDETHHYGHEKVEYFSAVAEGLVILATAFAVGYAALSRLLAPRPLQDVGLGLVLAAVAGGLNLGLALALLWVGRREESIALEGEAYHLLTDVGTTVGVLAGVLLASWTGWYVVDPLIGLAVALNVARAGVSLLYRAAHDLMDTALPSEEVTAIQEAIEETVGEKGRYHALRTRRAGRRRFVDFHLLLPGRTTVQESHRLADAVEQAIRKRVPSAQVTIHVEPLEDEASWDAAEVGGISPGTENRPPREPS